MSKTFLLIRVPSWPFTPYPNRSTCPRPTGAWPCSEVSFTIRARRPIRKPLGPQGCPVPHLCEAARWAVRGGVAHGAVTKSNGDQGRWKEKKTLNLIHHNDMRNCPAWNPSNQGNKVVCRSREPMGTPTAHKYPGHIVID